jgi:hypothetical protein
MERVEGIEPSPKAWEAFVLPLNYTRRIHICVRKVVISAHLDNIGIEPCPRFQALRGGISSRSGWYIIPLSALRTNSI